MRFGWPTDDDDGCCSAANAKQVLEFGQERSNTPLTPTGRRLARHVWPPFAVDSTAPPLREIPHALFMLPPGVAMCTSLPDNQHSELVGQVKSVKPLPEGNP